MTAKSKLLLLNAVIIILFSLTIVCTGYASEDEEEDQIPWYKTIGVTGTNVFSFEHNKTYDYDEYDGYKDLLNFLLTKDSISAGLTFRLEYYTEELGERKNRYLLHKFFFSVNQPTWELTAGDFYTTIGRGLLVSIVKDDLVEVDTSVTGGQFILDTDKIDGQFMGGVVRELESELTHYIGGARIVGQLPHETRIGAGAVYFREDPDQITEEKTYLAGPSLEINAIKNFLDIYTEYSYIERQLSSSTITGHGFYFSSTFYLDSLTLLAEYKDYYHFNFQYNLAPTLDREDEPTTQEDERGSRFVLTYFWPGTSNNIYAGRVDFHTRDSGDVTTHTYAGANFYDIADRVYLELFAGYRVTFEDILKFSVDSSYKLDDRNSIQLHYKRESTRIEDFDDNDEDEIFLGFSRSPWLTATVMWQHSRLEILEKHSLWAFEGRIQPNDAFTFILFAGSRKGGLICSSGVCRVEDPFEGIEFRAEYRF